MRDAWRTTTRTQRILLALWCALIVLPSLGLGTQLVAQQRAARLAAVERHAARMGDGNGCVANGTTPPTWISTGAYIDRIPELSITSASWKVDFMVWFSWDGELTDPGSTFKLVNGEVTSRTLMHKVDKGAHHYTLYKVAAQITKPFDVARFPRDEHLLTVQIEDQALQSHELCYRAEPGVSGLSTRVVVPGYRTGAIEVSVRPHAYQTSLGQPGLAADHKATYSSFVVGIPITRVSWGMFVKMFVALFVAISVAILGLILHAPAERLALAGTALFVAIGNATGISSLIPDTGTTTLADIVGSLGILFVGYALVQGIIYHRFLVDHPERRGCGHLFDTLSIALLSVCYVALNVSIIKAATG